MKFRTRINYKRGQFDVLTPDNGVIECKNEAAATHVCHTLNELCKQLTKIADEPADITKLLDYWG